MFPTVTTELWSMILASRSILHVRYGSEIDPPRNTEIDVCINLVGSENWALKLDV